ncbi:MAG: hypothetical protein II929_00985 [Succinivibrio sp.]|nr:hypothetical protein [Succinivibrio sp.]
MALFKCPECGKEISEYAENCPSCGSPNPHYDPSIPKPGETFFPCHKHSDKKSIQRCGVCGKGMCSECAVNSVQLPDNTIMCPECYLTALKTETSKYKRSFIFSIISLVWFGFFILNSIISLIVGLYGGFEFSHIAFNLWVTLGFASLIPLLGKLFMGTLGDFFGALLFLKNPFFAFCLIFLLSIFLAPFVAVFSTYKTIKNFLFYKEAIKGNKTIIERYSAIVEGSVGN